ncbi:hypothetical protein EY01_15775, partial [Staphylococcus aureus]
VGEQAHHRQQEEGQAEEVDVDRAVALELAVDDVHAHMLIEAQHHRRAEHHGGGEQVPLDLEPRVVAEVQAVADQGVARRDERSEEHGVAGDFAEFFADPVHQPSESEKCRQGVSPLS